MGFTGLNPMNLLLGGTLVSYILRGRAEQAGPFVPRQVLWLLVVPIAIAGVMGTQHFDDILPEFFDRMAVAYTTWRGYLGVTVVKPVLLVLAALLVAAAVVKARKPETFVVALAAGACALALLMIGFVAISDIRLGMLASPRARAFFNEIGAHANDFGRVFVTAYALMLFTWWETKDARARLALFIVLGILSLGILLTFSRNAFLGFFVVNGLFLLWKFNMKKLALALLGTAVAAALAPGAVYRRIMYGFDSGSVDTVSAGRVEGLWLPLLPEVMRSPIYGSGLGSIMWSEPMRSGGGANVLQVTHPHNAYLQALLDMGALGLILLCAYFFHVWRGFRTLRLDPDLSPALRGLYQGAAAALLALLASNLTDGSLTPRPEQALLWLVIGMMYGQLDKRPVH
jgi:O-antigen ligase